MSKRLTLTGIGLSLALTIPLSALADHSDCHHKGGHDGKPCALSGCEHGKDSIKADSNKDGKVTKEEFMAAAKKRAETKFRHKDRNGDGVLDASDKKHKRPSFSDIDSNGDGNISRDEFEEHIKARHGKHGHH